MTLHRKKSKMAGDRGETVMKTFVRGILFFIGWVSGGGILCIASVTLLNMIGIHFPNESFVSGLFWGTWGVVAGQWLQRQVNTAHTPTTRSRLE